MSLFERSSAETAAQQPEPTVSKQLAELRNSKSSSSLSTPLDYQQLALAEPEWAAAMEAQLPDDSMCTVLDKNKQLLMVQEVLVKCSFNLQPVLAPLLLKIPLRYLAILLAPDALNPGRDADMILRLEPHADSPAALENELAGFLDRALQQDLVRHAQAQQQATRLRARASSAARREAEAHMLRVAEVWRKDHPILRPNDAWREIYQHRHLTALPMLEGASLGQGHQHSGSCDSTDQHPRNLHQRLHSFLADSRWASFPFWLHPTNSPGLERFSGLPRCGLCCKALACGGELLEP